MKNRFSTVFSLALIMSLLLTPATFAFEAEGSNSQVVSDSTALGTVGTAANPIVRVDGTDIEFDTWAKGKYFTEDCEFRNISSKNDVSFRLKPVYGPELKKVKFDAGIGKFGGTDKTLEKDVNYNDASFDSENEIDGRTIGGQYKSEEEKALYKANVYDEDKELGKLLADLNPTYQKASPTDTEYFPYVYMLEGSSANRRIFVDADDTTKSDGDPALSAAVYDINGAGTVVLIWKDSENADEWNAAQTAAAGFVAKVGDLNRTEYIQRFGGNLTHPYGQVTRKKELPGADITAYAWELKVGSDSKKNGTEETFAPDGMDGSYDGAVVTETITYGNVSSFELKTKGLPLAAYQRPQISGGSISEVND